MAAINGMIGNVSMSGAYVTNVHQWEADLTAEALDTTPFSPTSNYRTRIAGLKDWSGSFTSWADDTQALLEAGVVASLVLTATTSRTYTGSALITSVRTGIAADGSQRTVTSTFVGAGAPTAA